MWKCSLLILLAMLAVSCKTKSFTQLEYMPDMYRQMSVQAQEYDPATPNGEGMRPPVAGTVPRGYDPYTIAIMDTVAANALSNPLMPTADVMAAGKKYFNTYCIVCHGARGDGRGYIVPKFTMPPILYSDKVMAWPDGRIYHTITMGQGLMPSYATQIPAEQRWAIVYYVRALQKAAHPTAQDLQAARQSTITLDSDLPDTGKAEPWPKK
ncbi:MAG TPA: cytochrome c [bacterium]|jgi:mono/diheme cytochrome c family protein